jgi:hypothetical protein
MRGRLPFLTILVALGLWLVAIPSGASTYNWLPAGSGSTNVPGNWLPFGPPGFSDDTFFGKNGITYTITTVSPADTFNSVNVGGTGRVQFSFGDPLGVLNGFGVAGGGTASIISGTARAAAFSVGPLNGSLTITGPGTQAITTNPGAISGFGINGTATVNVNQGASLTGAAFQVPAASNGIGLLNLSDPPQGGQLSTFYATSLSIGTQGTGDVESAGASAVINGTLAMATNGTGTLHQFVGAGSSPSLTVTRTTVIGDNGVFGQPGGKGTLAIDAGGVDLQGAVSLGDVDGGGPDTLRMTGGNVLAEHGLTLSPSLNSILDLQGGSLQVLGYGFGPGRYGLTVNQSVPLTIDGPGAGPTLTLVEGSDSIKTATPLSLVVGHTGNGTLNLRSSASIGGFNVMGDAVVADQTSGVGIVDTDTSGAGMVVHGSLSVGPGNGAIQSHGSLSVVQWVNVLSGPSTGGSILQDRRSMRAFGGLAINGTKDTPSPGSATVTVQNGELLLPPASVLEIWSGGHLLLGSAADAVVDSGIVSGEIQMAGASLAGFSDTSVIHLRNGGILHGIGTVTERIVLDDTTATLAVLASDSTGGGPAPSRIRTLGGAGSLTVGDSTVAGSVVLGGVIRVEADSLCLLNHGVLDLGPHVILSGGTLNVPNGGHVASGAILEGYGTLGGNIIVDGTLSAHGLLSGSVSLKGNLNFGPTLARLELSNAPTMLATDVLTMRIGSAAHGAQDTLVVDQPLALNGVLDLRTWHADPAAAGDTLTLINAPSISGTFTDVTLDGTDAPSAVQVIYEPTRVRVAVLQSTTSVPPKSADPVALRFATDGTLVNPGFALDLPRAAEVHLSVYNVAGRHFAELENGRLEAGRYRFPFMQGTSGVYFGQAWIRDDKGTHVMSARLVRVR